MLAGFIIIVAAVAPTTTVCYTGANLSDLVDYNARQHRNHLPPASPSGYSSTANSTSHSRPVSGVY